MYRKTAAILALLSAATLAIAADTPSVHSKLTAAQIVEKNVSARGGLQAWRAVQTLSMSGKIEAGSKERPKLSPQSRKGAVRPAAQTTAEQVQLPLLIELKRTQKSRIEIQFNGQTAVQVFDGTNGWKLRPFLNRHDVEPFTAEEKKTESQMMDLDGPLIDYAAKGNKVELVGAEKVGDRDTYKLQVTARNGSVQHIWVDATTYLEVKVEGAPRRLDGKMHPVEVYYGDFQPASGGIVLPHLFETRVEGVKQPEKMLIESVLVNPKLDDKLFSKPN